MGHAQQGAAVPVDKIDLDQARSRRHLFISLPAEALGETVDRHDLAERAARHTGALAAAAFEKIKPARMRLGRRLGTHPAQDLFRIRRKAKTVAGGAAIWVSRRTTSGSVIDASRAELRGWPR